MNKNIFASVNRAPAMPDTINAAGGKAYALKNEELLATLAAVGTFADGFYSGADTQVQQLLKAANACSEKFVAKCAVYCRQQGKLKDMPVVLLATLLTRGDVGTIWAKNIFPQVVDNGKQLRNFIQVIRSGVVGRKSLGSAPKKLVQHWLNSRSPSQVWYQSVGANPSMADVIKLSRPHPATPEHRALFGHLIGKNPEDLTLLPIEYHELETWRQRGGTPPKGVPWEMLVSHAASDAHWTEIALNCTWTQLRMNLNTFERHGVFNNSDVVTSLATKLSHADQVRKSKVLPYQLLIAYQNATSAPPRLRNALQGAMEIACENVPSLNMRVVICPDVSGSMHSAPVTGSRGTATTAAKCIDVAALISAAIARKNPACHILPFDTRTHGTEDINPLDTIMTNSAKLAKYGGGGTDCSQPLQYMNSRGA